MDIRKFFGVQTKKSTSEPATNGKSKENEKKKKTRTNGNAVTKVKSPNNDEDSSMKKKQPSKKKKRNIIDSDSEEEVQLPPKKHKKSSIPSPKDSPSSKQSSHSSKKHQVQYVSETDEEDTFETLKKTQIPQKNGLGANSLSGTTKMQASKPKETKPIAHKMQSPAKFSPTSVLDYFGNSSVQRSDKKLVASSKRKATVGSTDDSTHEDEAIARQLQMEEDEELERQLHEDEDFARTLAMLDESPKHKKVKRNLDDEKTSVSSSTGKSPDKPDKKNEKLSAQKLNLEHSARELNKTTTDSQSTIKEKSPKKPSPVKASAKLAQMKRKEEASIQTASMDGAESTSFKSSSASLKEEKTSCKTTEKISPKKSQSKSPEESASKRQNYQAYRNYLNREGPRALGSKEIPQGADNCLEGLTFVLTGVLESLERDEAKSLVERYGGKVTGNISKKTNYLVQGRDSGASKTEKAESLGTRILDEDGLLNLIRTLPGKKSKYEIVAEAESKKCKQKTPEKNEKTTPVKSSGKKKRTTPLKKESEKAICSSPKVKKSLSFKQEKSDINSDTPTVKDGESLLWVDKYKPTSLKSIIGQQGEQSCAQKLIRWLRNWHQKNSGEKKPTAKFGKFGGKDDGSSFKAALLSGPPGIGKTTTAVLVCEELGYSYVELNASCTRSKNSLKEVIAESLNNTSIKSFSMGKSQTVSSMHVLIMDEVDGMAGNEDRGGIQELIGLIKQTKIPIICMCNDRNHQKMRSLVNYCFDLRFQRPRVEQIKGAMMSIAFKEGLKIPPPALNAIILAANQDIRQVLHNLSMWSARDKVFTYDQAKADASKARKDIKIGPFDVCRKVFITGEETAHMTLVDKSDLFFHDYSLVPLFVQENYVHVKPVAAGGNLKKHLTLLSKAADSICDGDLVDKQIRKNQMWSLLPTQAIYASVLPGELMRGYMSQFPSFPSWLGKFSSTGKHSRIIEELSTHMFLRTHSSKQAVNLEYLSYIRDAIVKPLVHKGTDGVAEAVQVMDEYYLIKEDVDSIMEISNWGAQPDLYSKLDSKVKAAFTRTYNKEVHLTPYSLQAVSKGKRGRAATVDLDEEEFGTNNTQPEDNETEDTVEMDAMIKQKKVAKTSKEEKATVPKGKGKGKKTK
ncbi:replication factor C subunit 1 isoform X1 [Erpetoichthys calabaricus]|uniref:replication factor C subunit 1 isoform X1 n=2 Tax=Erpetoichthys calabaricus TaxID=27687 RepID=UPI00223432BA|nr:replication factor C subunit 1 isoform X1 [Erpetoichthys calabaricus]